MKVGFLVEFNTDANGDIGKIREAIHSAIQVSPDWFDLSDTEEERLHESEDIEGYLLRRGHL